MKDNGFGLSVIQRLLKTSVKKNLYWEVKDKVIEEAYDGYRLDKIKRKVKVYCLNSSKGVRKRLIDILYERVALHKDKFVAPIIYDEMKAMEVKKNGKVEHSDNSHDDQVFSYLMALYVWYDGQNLAENWHLIKNTIQTDEDLDIDETGFEDALEKKEKIDFEEIRRDDEEFSADLEWVTKGVGITTTESFKDMIHQNDSIQRQMLLDTSVDAKEAYQRDFGIDPTQFGMSQGIMTVKLPDNLFLDDKDIDLDEDGNIIEGNHKVLQGNLSDFYDFI